MAAEKGSVPADIWRSEIRVTRASRVLATASRRRELQFIVLQQPVTELRCRETSPEHPFRAGQQSLLGTQQSFRGTPQPFRPTQQPLRASQQPLPPR